MSGFGYSKVYNEHYGKITVEGTLYNLPSLEELGITVKVENKASFVNDVEQARRHEISVLLADPVDDISKKIAEQVRNKIVERILTLAKESADVTLYEQGIIRSIHLCDAPGFNHNNGKLYPGWETIPEDKWLSIEKSLKEFLENDKALVAIKEEIKNQNQMEIENFQATLLKKNQKRIEPMIKLLKQEFGSNPEVMEKIMDKNFINNLIAVTSEKKSR